MNLVMFAITEDELDALASPWSWWRRRRIVRCIKRESAGVAPEAAKEAE